MDTNRIFDQSKLIAGITVPDTALARAAVEYAYEHSSPMLFNHVMRSYYFGCLIGSGSVADFDREVVFLATILHDLGLTDAARGSRRFEIEGADAARKFLETHAFDGNRSWLVWDTIALHTWDVNLWKETEAKISQLGIMCDAVGFGLDAIDPLAVAEIIDAFPRLEFKSGFVELLKEEAREKPGTHIVHPVHMIAHHCCYTVAIPDAQAMIEGSPHSS